MSETIGPGRESKPEEIKLGEVKPEDIRVEDFEATPRELGRGANTLLGIFMVALSIFQLYTSYVGPFPDLVQRSIHLFFVLPAAFIMYPAFKKSLKRNEIPFYDWIFLILAIVPTLWVTLNYERIQMNPGLSTTIDLFLAPLLILVILETTRRILGPVLPTLSLLLIVYAFLGPHLPGRWAHRGFTLQMVLESLYLEPDGIFGYVVGISAAIIAGFLIFGVMMSETGASETFVNLAKKLAGRSHGGPAKVSCFSSALFGTISGSAVANVVVDGVFNIPLMKSLGYKKEFAAAVEATTSTGGQVMPPIMGAGAFIMAEILGMPYVKIAAAAAIPALLFYEGCFWGVHFWAQKLHLKPLPPEEIPSFRKKILPQSPAFIIPVSALVFFLCLGRNPALSVFYSVMLSFASYLVLPNALRQSLGVRVRNIIKALDHGGRAIVMVATLCACAQMVIGLLTVTGFGIKISEMVVSLSGNNVFLCLFFTMIVATILGMGVPTTAAYVLGASVCVPPLMKLGVDPLIAHMFVFYYAILSAITPPVCSAVYVAAALAGSNWLKTGFLACQLGLAGFIVPFAFFFAPALLLKGDVIDIIQNSVTAYLGVFCLSAATIGFLRRSLSWPERLILSIGGFMFIDPGTITDIVGGIILSYMYFSQFFGFSLGGWMKGQKSEAG
jgi:TRAP transporter 4TM/12TM fusion protein